MKTRHAATLGLLLFAAGAALADKPILNFHDQPVPVNRDGSSPTLEEVKQAIIMGCRLRRWTPVIGSENEIKCSILVRGRHYAEVSIPYSRESYSIVYSDSRVLDYNEKKQRIHRNYNNWVNNLAAAIQRKFDTIQPQSGMTPEDQ